MLIGDYGVVFLFVCLFVNGGSNRVTHADAFMMLVPLCNMYVSMMQSFMLHVSLAIKRINFHPVLQIALFLF